MNKKILSRILVVAGILATVGVVVTLVTKKKAKCKWAKCPEGGNYDAIHD